MPGELLRSYLAFWTVLCLLAAVGAYALHELAQLPGGRPPLNFPQIEVRHYGP